MSKAKRKQLLRWAELAIDQEWTEQELKTVLRETIGLASTSDLRRFYRGTFQEDATAERVAFSLESYALGEG